MSGDDPGERVVEHGPIGRALSTSVRGNSTAFGFSIMITASYGVLAALHPPSLVEILMFAVAATVAVAILEGAVTQGFRLRASKVPSEIQLLGTAMNLISVGAAVASAIAVGEILGAGSSWPVGGLVASLVYMVAESCEILIAEHIQRLRGDPQAGQEETE